jgi:cellulose biosynthesis protein BcsQ
VTLFNDRSTASKVIYAKLKQKYQEKIFKTLIHFDAKMQESQIVNEPIAYYDEDAIAAQQYHALAKEIDKI